MEAHARRTDPDTSHEAAAAATRKLTEKQVAVLALLSWGGVMTDEELVTAYSARLIAGIHSIPVGRGSQTLPRQSDSGIRTRRSELHARGLVGSIGYAGTRAGNRARVWSITPAGIEALNGSGG